VTKPVFLFTLGWLAAGVAAQSAERATSLQISSSVEFQFSDLPPLPDPNGVAGALAGFSNGTLLAGGGANFPDRKPWEGGTKIWHNAVWALPRNGTSWTTVSQLAMPRAYSVCLTTSQGVVCIGGDNAEQISREVLVLNWQNDRLTSSQLPQLPVPLTWAAGALLDDRVYVLGGINKLGSTVGTRSFLRLDLKNSSRGWEELDPWPGAARIFPVTAVYGGKLYLCSGAELSTGPDGKPLRKYLKDAYCYSPGSGWTRISDMPRAAVAACGPCPEAPGGFHILGGDDGSLASVKPWPGHPGFTKTFLTYNASADTWTETPCRALPVSAPLVPANGGYVFISGEIRPGIRTPNVIRLKSEL
jgi:N-acetylneuraminic acid mutarotase